MARKPNYDFEKRRKELERKAKKDAKAQRKLDNAGRPEDGEPQADGADGSADDDAAAVRPE